MLPADPALPGTAVHSGQYSSCPTLGSIEMIRRTRRAIRDGVVAIRRAASGENAIRQRMLDLVDEEGDVAAEEYLRSHRKDFISERFFSRTLAVLGSKVVDPHVGLRLLREADDQCPTPNTARLLGQNAFRRGALTEAKGMIDVWLERTKHRDINLADQKWIGRWRHLTEIGPTSFGSLDRKPLAIEPAPKRVLYCLHNSLPWNSGGYATRTHGLLTGLRGAGFEMIGCTRPGFPEDRKDLVERVEKIGVAPEDVVEGIRYRRLEGPSLTGEPVLDYIATCRAIWQRVIREERPSVMHAASNYLTALPAVLAARDLGVPAVYEVRGFWEVTRASREPEYAQSEHYAVLRDMEAFTATTAEQVLTLTSAMRDELIRRGVPGDKITLAPNAVDSDRFVPRARDEALARELEIGSSPVVGYVGTFAPYEGLDDLLRAARLLIDRGVDFKLLLVGSGAEAGKLERLVGELDLRDRVRMPGRVPHEDVERYYSLIDIAPFPRIPVPVCEMVSPMKPLEAMAMEKAVVVSSVAALAEMVEPEETGVVYEKGSESALADALARLLPDDAMRRRLGESARRWARDERSWSNTVQQVALAYQSPTMQPLRQEGSSPDTGAIGATSAVAT